MHVVLELKSIADVGLVGFPNAGKSSLLCALSRARPRIAAYPFTTLRPYIGTVEFEDQFCIRMADIPGLIEDAHANVGMGLRFLRHVERTHVLLFVVDLLGFQLSTGSPFRNAADTLALLARELDLYQSAMLSTRPCVVAANKTDLPDSAPALAALRDAIAVRDDLKRFRGAPLVPISAAQQVGLGELTSALRAIVEPSMAARAASQAAVAAAAAMPLDPELARVYRQEAQRLVG